MVFQTGEQGQQGHGANARKTAATAVAGSTLVGVIMGCAAKQEADEEEGDGEETEES
jgi:hypothetical protein